MTDTTKRTSRGSPRSWARLFVASGAGALVLTPTACGCGGSDLGIISRDLCAGAVVLCATGALAYLLTARRVESPPARTAGLPTRTLALVALVLAGGPILLFLLFITLLMLFPSDF